VTLANAPQADAPTILPGANGLLAAWVGSDDAGVHHDALRVIDGLLSPVTVLPLPPQRPRAQTLFPAPADAAHLLWLDSASTHAEPRLYAALLTPDLRVERGPTPVSDALALRYAALPATDGSVWAAWSGGLVAEPTLSIRSIDPEGRPRPAMEVASAADFPALVGVDNVLYLFWLSVADGQLLRARLRDGVIESTAMLTSGVSLRPGDRLDTLTAGVDATHAYVFWNITRLEGGAETWWAAGAPDARVWNPPRRLSVSVPGAAYQPPFSAGGARRIEAGDRPLSRVAPAGMDGALAAAAQTGDGRLVIVYFERGAPAGLADFAPTRGLVGMPALYADAQRRLYLAWAEPAPDTPAALRLLITAP
jgi:hypothetical protein